MHRIRRQAQAEAIARALDLIPGEIRAMLEPTHFLVGVDPVFVGLERPIRAADGRSFREMGHIVYGFGLSRPAADRVTTIVLPDPTDLWTETIVHELGHRLHELIGWDPTVRPVTAYARRDRWEAFAESFTAWVLGPHAERCDWPGWRPTYRRAHEILHRQDPATVDLLRRLADGVPLPGHAGIARPLDGV